jgi:hypothetical protein
LAHKENNIIDCKRVYKIKRNVDGNNDHYTTRLVAKCFKQRYGYTIRTHLIMLSNILPFD